MWPFWRHCLFQCSTYWYSLQQGYIWTKRCPAYNVEIIEKRYNTRMCILKQYTLDIKYSVLNVVKLKLYQLTQQAHTKTLAKHYIYLIRAVSCSITQLLITMVHHHSHMFHFHCHLSHLSVPPVCKDLPVPIASHPLHQARRLSPLAQLSWRNYY